MATQHATPETLDLAPAGRSGPPRAPSTHPRADPAGPRKAGGCHNRPHRPCPRGKAHTLAKGRSSACSTPCDGGEPAPLDTKGSPGSGRQGRHRCTSRAASSSSRSHGQHPPLGLARRRDPPLTWLQVSRTPRGPEKGAHATLALQWVRRHEVGHSPPPSGPLGLAPVHTPIGCQVFERQVSPILSRTPRMRPTPHL